MSGPHLVKKGREHRKMDLQRDFTVASPAEFVTRFGGNRVIEKVRVKALIWFVFMIQRQLSKANQYSFYFYDTGVDRQQWHCSSQMHAFYPSLVL